MISEWSPYLDGIEALLDEFYLTNKVIYPERQNVLKAFEYFKPEETRVVLLGMDPYINEGQAMGLSFSVPEGQLIPPSLRNLFKEIESDLKIEMDFKKGDLTKWAKDEKILLLNSALTVEKGRSGSHLERWKPFTDSLIKQLSNNFPSIVFILLGNHAKSKWDLIKNKSRVVTAVHPSPLSASRGFFGSKIFSKCNKILGMDVDWKNY